MTPELERALKNHQQWFGSHRRTGDLVKVHVWLILNTGSIECMTGAGSYKVQRARRNPRVVCFVGSKDGPSIAGTAEIIPDRAEVWRVYRAYWKTHPLVMVFIGLRIWIEAALGRRVVVRVRPDEPNPVAGLTDPA